MIIIVTHYVIVGFGGKSPAVVQAAYYRQYIESSNYKRYKISHVTVIHVPVTYFKVTF